MEKIVDLGTTLKLGRKPKGGTMLSRFNLCLEKVTESKLNGIGPIVRDSPHVPTRLYVRYRANIWVTRISTPTNAFPGKH